MNGELCLDEEDPTTCSEAADWYCCILGDMEDCYDNALLMEYLSEWKWDGVSVYPLGGYDDSPRLAIYIISMKLCTVLISEGLAVFRDQQQLATDAGRFGSGENIYHVMHESIFCPPLSPSKAP